MGIATANLDGFKSALAEAVALSADSVVAPLDMMHTIHRIQTKSIDVPVGSGLSYSSATAGTVSEGGTNSNTLTALTLTPVPFKCSVDIAKADLQQNPYFLSYLAEELTKGAADHIVTLLDDVYDTHTAYGTTGASATVALLMDAVGEIRGAGFSGRMYANMHPTVMADLKANFAANYGNLPQVAAQFDQNELFNIAGVVCGDSSSITSSTSGYKNFIGPKDAVHIAIRDVDAEDVWVLERDGVNVNVGAQLWVAVGKTSAGKGRFLPWD